MSRENVTAVTRVGRRWPAADGYDGQPGDAILVLDDYLAHSHDPTVGPWLEADSWRSDLGDPQSQNRYAYVKNSPVSFADAFGFVHTRFDGGGGSGRSPGYRSEAQREQTRMLNRIKAHRSIVGQLPLRTLGTSNARYGGPVPEGAVNPPRSRSGVSHPAVRRLQIADDTSERLVAHGEGRRA